jgi:lambda repressor-like predicted transcriptional regulator
VGIEAEFERIHRAKVAGRPLYDCLRDVVRIIAACSTELPDDKLCAQVVETARVTALRYGWATTLVERSVVQMTLRTHAAEWIAETGGPSPEAKPKFPVRAAWLRAELKKKGWSKHDLARHGGPDHKSTQKVLNGLWVQDGVLQKIADALKIPLNVIPRT